MLFIVSNVKRKNNIKYQRFNNTRRKETGERNKDCSLICIYEMFLYFTDISVLQKQLHFLWRLKSTCIILQSSTTFCITCIIETSNNGGGIFTEKETRDSAQSYYDRIKN